MPLFLGISQQLSSVGELIKRTEVSAWLTEFLGLITGPPGPGWAGQPGLNLLGMPWGLLKTAQEKLSPAPGHSRPNEHKEGVQIYGSTFSVIGTPDA